MQLVDGEDLERILERDGRLPLNVALRIVVDVARALQAAHERGIVHRDVKPANILVDRNGDVRVVDSGSRVQPTRLSGSRRPGSSSDPPSTSALNRSPAAGSRTRPTSIRSASSCTSQSRAGGRSTDPRRRPWHWSDSTSGRAPPSAVAHDLPPAIDALVLRASNAIRVRDTRPLATSRPHSNCGGSGCSAACGEEVQGRATLNTAPVRWRRYRRRGDRRRSGRGRSGRQRCRTVPAGSDRPRRARRWARRPAARYVPPHGIATAVADWLRFCSCRLAHSHCSRSSTLALLGSLGRDGGGVAGETGHAASESARRGRATDDAATHAHANADTNADADPDTDADADSHTDSDADADADPGAHSYAQADARPNPTAAGDATSGTGATLAVSLPRPSPASTASSSRNGSTTRPRSGRPRCRQRYPPEGNIDGRFAPTTDNRPPTERDHRVRSRCGHRDGGGGHHRVSRVGAVTASLRRRLGPRARRRPVADE